MINLLVEKSSMEYRASILCDRIFGVMEGYHGNWYVLIWNLELEESLLKLGRGIGIRRLDGDISLGALLAAGKAGFRECPMLVPFISRCSCEIEVEPDEASESAGKAVDKAWLASALIRLRGFSGHLPVASSSYSWSVIAGHQERILRIMEEELREEFKEKLKEISKEEFEEKFEQSGVESAVHSSKMGLPPFEGQVLDVQARLLGDEDTKRILRKEDADWINENYEKFSRLREESEAFNLALAVAVEWQYASSPRMAIAQLWSGIEALFKINQELVYRISLQVASLLEGRGDKRKERLNQVKKLYGTRSKAVHGEELSDDKLHKAMIESFDILNKLLLVNIEKGRPFRSDDFEEAILY